MNRRTKQGAPTYHSQSAHAGHAAKRSVPRMVRTQADIERENQMMAFKCGLFLGVAVAALAFGLILWLWVIPTMDAAVATARGMVA